MGMFSQASKPFMEKKSQEPTFEDKVKEAARRRRETAKLKVEENKDRLLAPFVEIFGEEFVRENLVFDHTYLDYKGDKYDQESQILEIGVRPAHLAEGIGVVKLDTSFYHGRLGYVGKPTWRLPSGTSSTWNEPEKVEALTAYWDSFNA